VSCFYVGCHYSIARTRRDGCKQDNTFQDMVPLQSLNNSHGLKVIERERLPARWALALLVGCHIMLLILVFCYRPRPSDLVILGFRQLCCRKEVALCFVPVYLALIVQYLFIIVTSASNLLVRRVRFCLPGGLWRNVEPCCHTHDSQTTLTVSPRDRARSVSRCTQPRTTVTAYSVWCLVVRYPQSTLIRPLVAIN